MSGILSAATSLIQPAVDIFRQSWQNRVNSAQANKQRDFQREMANYAYTKDLEMWNKSNQYNTPAAQMQRLKDAGLNPNLAYGQATTGTTATQMPKYQKYDTPVAQLTVPKFDAASTIQKFQDITLRQAQIDNVKAQNDVIKADAYQKKISNMFLSSNLSQRNMGQFYATKKAQAELGLLRPDNDEVDTWVGKSPYMRKYNAEINSRNLQNSLLGLEKNLKRKGMTWSDSLLLRMYLQGQLTGTEMSKLAPYVLLNGISKVKF